MGLEKYKELYAYSNSLLKEEHDRFNRVDQKAALYLSVVTLLIGIQGSFGKELLGSLIPPATFLQWMLLNVGILSFLMLVATWFVIFRTLRIQGLKMPPLNHEMVEFFSNQSEINIYYHIAKANADAREHNIKITEQKCKALYWGYQLIVATVCVFVIFTCLFFVQVWATPPANVNMKSQQSSDTKAPVPNKPPPAPAPPAQTVPDSPPKVMLQPDPNVKVPEYVALANERRVLSE